jgi:tRNA(fMet)-specific endonuclease VapC
MYLLDTNTLIYFFKSTGKVADTLLSKSPRDIAIPSISIFELEVGIAKSVNPKKRKRQLESMVSLLTIIPFGENESKVAAKIRADLEAMGKPIGPYDTLIAGTAVSSNCVLVTHNTKEFSRIKNLKIEDWYQ